MTASHLVHRDLDNGLHVVEALPTAFGAAETGIPVVLCHGFPGSWFSWRNQLPALAAAGHRVIAPDMRGYGRSLRPADAAEYDRASTVADMTGLLDELGIDKAVFVGHDFGAHLVWDLPAWAPKRVAGLIALSVPRLPRSPVLPSKAYAHMAQQHFLHFHYFQEPGVADAELDAQPAEFLRRIFYALSGDGHYLDCWDFPSAGNGYLDVLPEAPPLPWSWLSEDEFAYYVDEFSRTGFTGGLNWYRANDTVWQQNAPHDDKPITVPTAFIAGAADPVLTMMGRQCLDTMATLVPGLRSTDVLPGAGHFVQMEAAEEVNALMLEFLGGL